MPRSSCKGPRRNPRHYLGVNPGSGGKVVRRPRHACPSHSRARAATCHSWAQPGSPFRRARTTTWRSKNARRSPCATMVGPLHPLMASDNPARAAGVDGRLTRDRALHTSHCRHDTRSVWLPGLLVKLDPVESLRTCVGGSAVSSTRVRSSRYEARYIRLGSRVDQRRLVQ